MDGCELHVNCIITVLKIVNIDSSNIDNRDLEMTEMVVTGREYGSMDVA